jgi:hypothetical protein
MRQNIDSEGGGFDQWGGESIHRVFLLSPAYAGGRRAQMMLSERAQFALARKLRSRRGATIRSIFRRLCHHADARVG